MNSIRVKLKLLGDDGDPIRIRLMSMCSIFWSFILFFSLFHYIFLRSAFAPLWLCCWCRQTYVFNIRCVWLTMAAVYRIFHKGMNNKGKRKMNYACTLLGHSIKKSFFFSLAASHPATGIQLIFSAYFFFLLAYNLAIGRPTYIYNIRHNCF